jgi:hypothetical protein
MFEGLERITSTSDWVTIFFLVVLTLISILQFNFNERFSKLFSLIYSDKYYTDFIKTRPLNFNIFHLIFFFVVLFNISMLLFFVFKTYKPSIYHSELSFYLKINIAVFTFFALRYLAGRMIAGIFNLSEEQSYFTFLKMSNLCLISVLILPLLILSNYSSGFFHKFLINFTVVASVGITLFRYFVVIKNEKLGFNNLFYLFLYLCALELSPLIVVYKLFVD